MRLCCEPCVWLLVKLCGRRSWFSLLYLSDYRMCKGAWLKSFHLQLLNRRHSYNNLFSVFGFFSQIELKPLFASWKKIWILRFFSLWDWTDSCNFYEFQISLFSSTPWHCNILTIWTIQNTTPFYFCWCPWFFNYV
jgi:hypothetical protein